MSKKRAQGLSITTIIVAVIGLIILVVLIAIFTGRLGAFGKGLEEQEKFGKKCEEFNNDPTVRDAFLQRKGVVCPRDYIEQVSSDSIATGRKCCVEPD